MQGNNKLFITCVFYIHRYNGNGAGTIIAAAVVIICNGTVVPVVFAIYKAGSCKRAGNAVCNGLKKGTGTLGYVVVYIVYRWRSKSKIAG